MKRSVLVLLFLILSVLGFSKIVNWVVARVGSYSITSYDIKQMTSFKKGSGDQTATDKDSLEELLLSYSIMTLARQNPNYQSQDREVDNYITSVTNITNREDVQAQLRLKLYRDYPEQYKLQIERNQVLRALLFYDNELKEQVNTESPMDELKKYYDKNKNRYAEPPQVDLVVLGIEQPNNLSLEALVKMEENIDQIGDYLKKTNDPNKIYSRVPGIKFASYSGRTDIKSVRDLLYAGMPEMILNIALSPSINTGSKTININKGTVVVINQPILLKETKRYTYLIIKLIDLKPGGLQPFEKVINEVKIHYKDERTVEMVQDYVSKKIQSGELNLNLIDNNYQGVYDGFIRR